MRTNAIELGHKKNPATCANRSGAMAIVGKDDHVTNGICSIPGCDRTGKMRRTWCEAHYDRWRKYGDVNHPAILRPSTPAESLKLRTVHVNGCHIWTGAVTSTGYGSMKAYGKSNRAHRVAYIEANGPIPEGMYIDHICQVRLCVNPEHLRLATAKQNQEHRPSESSMTKSGFRGVSWNPRYQLWRGRVKHNGKVVFERSFKTIEEAQAAVTEVRNQFFTHNNHDRKAS